MVNSLKGVPVGLGVELASEQLPAPYKRVLAALYRSALLELPRTATSLAEQLEVTEDYVQEVCRQLEAAGLVRRQGEEWELTRQGRESIVVVMAGGVFDIIHPGHIYTLKASKELGDVLVVSVARNRTVEEMKGHRPHNDEKERARLVASLRFVDVALLGSERDIFETVEAVRPDIIAVGYDQKHDERILLEESRKRGVRVKVVRLSSPIPSVKTSKLKEDVRVLREF
jgi:cytidyltransferase-like protein